MFGEKEKKQKKVGKAESTESWRNVEDSVISYLLSRDKSYDHLPALKPLPGQRGMMPSYNEMLRNQVELKKQFAEPVFRNAEKKSIKPVGKKQDTDMGTMWNRVKQTILKDLNLYKGKIDGVWGGESEAATQQFESIYGYSLEYALCNEYAAKGMIYELKKKRESKEQDIQKQGKGEGWIQIVDNVAQWYAANIKTYCSRTDKEHKEHGGLSTDGGRSGIKCELGGKLKGQLVGDDCSSFLQACLVQAGYLEKNKYKTEVWGPNSEAYLPGGDGAKNLEAAGFVWIPKNKFMADTKQPEQLQKGDILVVNGHVEVFSHFDSEGKECAWTWGKIYTAEPAQKGSTKDTIWNWYDGVWRLK